MKKKRRIISIVAIFCFAIGIISYTVAFIGKKNQFFAEWITVNVSYHIRKFLADVTSGASFSIAEILIIISPLIIASIIFFAAKANGARQRLRFISSLLAVVSLFYSMYVFTLGIGYRRVPIADKLKLEEINITDDNLYSTLIYLKEQCEVFVDEIEYDENGSSVFGNSFDDICDKIVIGYDKLSADYPDLQIRNFDSDAKEVHFSEAMTAFDILGVYTFFTGESNVNVHYPDYTAPFTIAHELAHQRGISRENEANFIAFLVCIRTDDPYIQYSGYLNMFEYLASALAKTNKELLKEVYSELDDRIYGEMLAYNDFYHQNKNELMGQISEFFNDNYLKSQGTEGIVSYGLVVKLCVAYYNK